MELLFVERAIIIRNRGSIEFSAAEQAADIVLVDVKCEAISGTIYTNNKTLPSYGYFGAVTLFAGATVREKISLEFPYQRVLDFESLYRRLRCYLTRISVRQEETAEARPWNYFTPLGTANIPDSFKYRGLPYSKLKINSERLAQYTVTVRRYTEDNGFACQSQNSPDDPTDGEEEYPRPLAIPPSGVFPTTLPAPTAAPTGANPNDFPADNQPPWIPKPVSFGWRGRASTGAAPGPDRCALDTTINENFTWTNAGKPPYTAILGTGVASCNLLKLGIRIRDADGGLSPLQAGFAGFGSVELIVFTIL